ncbi:hypothetical protein [Endozoicomonas sp. 4G]|uniref:hypothetical protein n=1 Tax=Endozoicomonas sp. 4G TaxID=2872754 RepID=UPI002078EC99|nr:hypothetical protein [Endozoicomonas sp. 4G]
MNKFKILENALCAVNHRQTEARNQVRDCRDLGNEEAMQYWEKEIDKAEATYQGLLEMLSDLYGGELNGELKAKPGELNSGQGVRP